MRFYDTVIEVIRFDATQDGNIGPSISVQDKQMRRCEILSGSLSTNWHPIWYLAWVHMTIYIDYRVNLLPP